MPRPSYKHLREENAQLKRELGALRTYAPFNVTTRAGIPFEIERLGTQPRFVLFLDIDDMHGANKKYGHEAVNGKIKRALHVRSVDVLARAQWYSGDEFTIILAGNPEGIIDRLGTALKNEGLSATMAAVPYTGNLEADVRIALAIVEAAKANRPR